MRDLFFAKDHILILRPTFVTRDSAARAAKIAEGWCGFHYDWKFERGNYHHNSMLLYCAEVPQDAYTEAEKPNKIEFERKLRMGVDTIQPDDYAKAREKFDVVAIWPPEDMKWVKMQSKPS